MGGRGVQRPRKTRVTVKEAYQRLREAEEDKMIGTLIWMQAYLLFGPCGVVLCWVCECNMTVVLGAFFLCHRHCCRI